MIYLLDTHVLIWSLMHVEKLSDKVREIIENQENTILVSAGTFWEISLKVSLNKLNFQGVKPEDFPRLALETGFELIPILPEEAANYHQLKADWHKDPFDRMLIWQAIQRKVMLISKDEQVLKYANAGLKVVW